MGKLYCNIWLQGQKLYKQHGDFHDPRLYEADVGRLTPQVFFKTDSFLILL